MPVDDDEAVRRIVAAARAAIDESGGLSVSAVSQALGVTRQTVYRYFPTQEALLVGTAMSAVGEFLDRLAAELGSINDPIDAVIEGIAYTVEQLPHDSYLSLVMQPGKASAFTAGVTSDVAIGFGRSILERFDVDWPMSGFAGHKLDELVEFMLRILQSLIVDPGRPQRRGDALRQYLREWVAPAVRARSACSR
jgi:AcrR family transcriptional regulator